MRGHSESDGWESQYQEENLPRTWVRGFGFRSAGVCTAPDACKGGTGSRLLVPWKRRRHKGGRRRPVTLGVLRNKFVGCEAEATWDALRDAAHRSELAHVDETGKVQASCAGHGQ